MIDFITTHPWSLCMAWIVACYLVFMCLFITGSDADDEAEKMGRVWRVK